MFRPLQGVDSSISIGRIERRYESLKTYDTYTKSIETLKYFWQALKYFYIMCDIALIRQLACSQVIQQLVAE